MASKVYLKTSGLTADERRMVRALEKAIKAKVKEDPAFTVTPARNMAELRQYHNRYCAEDAQIISETVNPPKGKKETVVENNTTEGDQTEESEEPAEPKTDPKPKSEPMAKKELVDPMLRDNTIEREYTTSTDASSVPESQKITATPSSNSLDEPGSFESAFNIPDGSTPGASSSGPSSGPAQKKQEKVPPKTYAPINPDNTDMTTTKKNKMTRRYAKYIVEATAMLTEKGCIWWVTKDINDVKLAEYELDGTMNLEMMFSMDGETQVTVRQFFQMHCRQAQEQYKWTEEEKTELADALYDVMIERGIAPTPMQNLLIVAATIVGGKLFTAFGNRMQINMIKNHPEVKIEKAPEPEVIEEKPPVKAEKTKPAKPQAEVVDDDSRDVDPEKVMNGTQQVVSTPATGGKKRNRKKETVN